MFFILYSNTFQIKVAIKFHVGERNSNINTYINQKPLILKKIWIILDLKKFTSSSRNNLNMYTNISSPWYFYTYKIAQIWRNRPPGKIS